MSRPDYQKAPTGCQECGSKKTDSEPVVITDDEIGEPINDDEGEV